MSKGKFLSRTDLGFAVITCDSVRWKIDIDEERQVYHLKVCIYTDKQLIGKFAYLGRDSRGVEFS